MCLTTPGRQPSTSGLGPSLKWLPWLLGEPVEESEELSGLEGTVALTWVSLAVINYTQNTDLNQTLTDTLCFHHLILVD